MVMEATAGAADGIRQQPVRIAGKEHLTGMPCPDGSGGLFHANDLIPGRKL